MGIFYGIRALWIATLRGLAGALWLIPAGVIWALCAVSVVLLPFGTTGLFVVANRVAYGQPVAPREVLALARAYARPAVQLTLLGLLAVGLLVVGRGGSGPLPDAPSALRPIATLAGIILLVLLFYAWPLLFEHADRRALPVLRSAALLVLAEPNFTLVVAGTAAILVLLLRVALPYGVLGAGYVALLGTTAVLDRLSAFGQVPDPDRIAAR